jgi:hypothetical protein
MRPLYLEGIPGSRVVLDQPALRVVFPDKADSLFPLSRISRIVCKGCVEWSMSALLACADEGIQLIFLAANGQVRARWLGQVGERQILAQRLSDLLLRADGLILYTNWFAAIEKLAVRSFARRMGLSDWREISVKAIRKSVALSLSAQEQEAIQILQSLMQSELYVWLADCGLCSDDEVLLHQLDLAASFSQLLIWDFYPIFLVEHTANPVEFGKLAELFQQRNQRLYVLFRSTISKLQQFLLTIS